MGTYFLGKFLANVWKLPYSYFVMLWLENLLALQLEYWRCRWLMCIVIHLFAGNRSFADWYCQPCEIGNWSSNSSQMLSALHSLLLRIILPSRFGFLSHSFLQSPRNYGFAWFSILWKQRRFHQETKTTNDWFYCRETHRHER